MVNEYINNTELVFDYYKKQHVNGNHSHMAENTSSTFTDDWRCLTLKYWGDEYLVDNLSGDISLKNNVEKRVSVMDRIIIMSHLLDSKDSAAVSKKFVPYRNIKKAAPYEKAFIKRTIKPINEAFTSK